MDNKQVIHIASEVVLLGGITYYFDSRYKSLDKRHNEAIAVIESQNNRISMLENYIYGNAQQQRPQQIHQRPQQQQQRPQQIQQRPQQQQRPPQQRPPQQMPQPIQHHQQPEEEEEEIQIRDEELDKEMEDELKELEKGDSVTDISGSQEVTVNPPPVTDLDEGVEFIDVNQFKSKKGKK